MGCLGFLFKYSTTYLVDIVFFEEWAPEGHKVFNFEAIEERLIPAIESRMLGHWEGDGRFLDHVEINIGFVLKKKTFDVALGVLRRELKDMGAPSSTKIVIRSKAGDREYGLE